MGSRNVLVPPTAYTEHSIAVPGGAAGPGGDVRFYNLIPAFNGLQDNVFDNQDALDTTFNGVEITASKRVNDRRITPMFEIFNLSNADTVVGYNANVGSSYPRPTEILSPRLLRLGISFDF